MRKLEREIKALRRGSEVFLCFTCDPYQPLEAKTRVTRRVIEMLHAHEVAARILTKAGRLSTRDFDLLSARPDLSAYGATLTFISPASAKRWEPGAASPISRLRALEKAHSLGIPTWASLEPVIDPAQSLELIRTAAPFVDKFKVGRWNHDVRANGIDWRAFVKGAVELLRERGKAYYVKLETRPYLPKGVAAEWAGR
jgi:DNA repair photolyase